VPRICPVASTPRILEMPVLVGRKGALPIAVMNFSCQDTFSVLGLHAQNASAISPFPHTERRTHRAIAEKGYPVVGSYRADSSISYISSNGGPSSARMRM
jgi:hypothetical protein